MSNYLGVLSLIGLVATVGAGVGVGSGVSMMYMALAKEEQEQQKSTAAVAHSIRERKSPVAVQKQ